MYNALLKQARELAERDANKPIEVNLRRAVSAAYYGLFHFLVDRACRVIVGGRRDQLAYRQLLARAFKHEEMKKACDSLSAGTLKPGVERVLGKQWAEQFKSIASTFIELQLKRNLADYDLSHRFTRSDVLQVVSDAEKAVEEFGQLEDSNEKRFFLTCLLLWNSLR